MAHRTSGHFQGILILLKAPEKGKVKTRLSGHIDSRHLVNLYRCFVTDIIKTLQDTGHPIRICYTPSKTEKKIRSWIGFEYVLWPQLGENLGDRMRNAFIRAFSEGMRQVVLIGADLPDLPSRIINEALTRLTTVESVIGPAADGGYYLIGFRPDTFKPEIFQQIPWGTSEVFQATMRQMRQHHANIHILPTWRDIDVIEDLEAFYLTHASNPTKAENTIGYLRRMGFRIRKASEAPGD